jgi:hypothetical protein
MLISDMFEIYYYFIIKDKSLNKQYVLYNLDKKLHHSQIFLLIIIRLLIVYYL